MVSLISVQYCRAPSLIWLFILHRPPQSKLEPDFRAELTAHDLLGMPSFDPRPFFCHNSIQSSA